jgi:hypothetical protein
MFAKRRLVTGLAAAAALVIPAGLEVGDVPSASSLFLVPDADACPAGSTARGELGLELQLAKPLQEVSCQEIGRLELRVDGCG